MWVDLYLRTAEESCTTLSHHTLLVIPSSDGTLAEAILLFGKMEGKICEDDSPVYGIWAGARTSTNDRYQDQNQVLWKEIAS